MKLATSGYESANNTRLQLFSILSMRGARKRKKCTVGNPTGGGGSESGFRKGGGGGQGANWIRLFHLILISS